MTENNIRKQFEKIENEVKWRIPFLRFLIFLDKLSRKRFFHYQFLFYAATILFLASLEEESLFSYRTAIFYIFIFALFFILFPYLIFSLFYIPLLAFFANVNGGYGKKRSLDFYNAYRLKESYRDLSLNPSKKLKKRFLRRLHLYYECSSLVWKCKRLYHLSDPLWLKDSSRVGNAHVRYKLPHIDDYLIKFIECILSLREVLKSNLLSASSDVITSDILLIEFNNIKHIENEFMLIKLAENIPVNRTAVNRNKLDYRFKSIDEKFPFLKVPMQSINKFVKWMYIKLNSDSDLEKKLYIILVGFLFLLPLYTILCFLFSLDFDEKIVISLVTLSLVTPTLYASLIKET